jgi:uncharacterized membrane protein
VFETAVDVAAAPEDVWAVLVDIERWPEWTASMSEVKLLDPGPLAVGVRARVKQPRLPPTVWEVTDLEPLGSFTWKSTSPGVTTIADHRLTTAGPGPVTMTLAIRRTGRMAPLVDRLFRRITEKYVRMEAEGLKRRCEGGQRA